MATKDFYTDADLAAYLLAEIAKRGWTQREWAAKHKLSESYVSDIVLGRRSAGPAMLKALGFEIAPYWRKIR